MNKQAVVAGAFYPANPEQLQQMLTGYLEDASAEQSVPKALIAPHAGYIYSGPIAASAYATLKKAKNRISRVVIIGPSHHIAFRGLAVSQADTFTTPLGTLTVDKLAIESITKFPFVDYDEQAYAYEHSVEVHLPFLQTTLVDFKIVPIVSGNATPEQVAEVIETLWGGYETLIVISSDLSHFLPYEKARQLDALTSQYIEQKKFEYLGYESACGKVPISGLLKVAREKSLAVKTLDLRNSGDTAGDKHRVVGYGAYALA